MCDRTEHCYIYSYDDITYTTGTYSKAVPQLSNVMYLSLKKVRQVQNQQASWTDRPIVGWGLPTVWTTGSVELTML